MSPLTEQKVDSNRCTCLKVYHVDKSGGVSCLGDDGEPEPVVFRVDPECPEPWKPGHPTLRKPRA